MFVRKDIPMAAQVVQTGHACLEAGSRFPQPGKDTSYLVVLAVQNERKLMEAVAEAKYHGVRSVVFFEPDNKLGHTASCTEPVQGETRHLFKRYPLWQPG